MTGWAVLTAFLVALGLSRHFCRPESWLHILDHPNARSLHSTPIPRSGGVALLGGVAAGLAILASQLTLAPLQGLLLGTMPIALVSFWDDYRGVSAGWRFLIHGAGAVILIMSGYGPDRLGALSWTLPASLTDLVLAVAIVWMINLYNFMDGLDGLAAGMAIFGFSCLAMLGSGSGNGAFVGMSLIIVAASAGFLVFNRPPARIFLGDIGSTVLGFWAAAFCLWGNRQGLFSLWMALLLFSPFVLDATLTLLRRLRQGEKIWQAHKTHYYQRLVVRGWSQRRVLFVEYMLMFFCGLSVLYAAQASSGVRIGLVLIWTAIYGGLVWGVGRLERARWGKT
ncbi:MAG: glycosyltransferase family 4 protein [Gammaproteobacteria bacterium]|nr:glycosyltransferase family 4 protein [Gammaproteobacteria bacterium]